MTGRLRHRWGKWGLEVTEVREVIVDDGRRTPSLPLMDDAEDGAPWDTVHLMTMGPLYRLRRAYGMGRGRESGYWA